MAKLEVIQCASCGSPLSPGALDCEYCGAKNVIKSKQNPLNISSDMAKKYIAFYGNKAKENPKDTNALYSMGLLYISLKNYELAQRNFKDAIDQSPLDADVYYYYALSLVAGKSIRAMNGNDVSRVEEYLGTALGMETKCKYLVLLAAVKEEYYTANHMVISGKGPRQLFEEATDYSPDDLEEITDNCTFRSDSTQYNIDLLTGKETEDDDDDDDDDGDGDDSDLISEEEHDEAMALTEEQRKNYFEYRFEPVKPGWGDNKPEDVRYRNVPKFIGFVIARALAFAGCFFIFLIMLTFGTCTGWGVKEKTTINSVDARLDAHVKTMAKKFDHTYTDLELEKKRAEFKEDSIKKDRQFEKDKEVSEADLNRIFSYIDNDDGTTQHFYIKKTFWGLFWILLIFSPLIWWFFATVRGLIGEINERKSAIKYNIALDDYYLKAMECYRTKPTDRQMENSAKILLPSLVWYEMQNHKKSEEDLKGITLFLNSNFKYDDQGENYEGSAVEYTIALLDEDCVTVIRGDWSVYEDEPDAGEFEQVSYGDIGSVRLTSDELSFGDITIEIPDEQIFEYQDDNDNDEYTFSSTRTSDVQTFAVSLRKLVQEYKNKH